MADIFSQSDIRKLLTNRLVWFFGGSNMRGLYKDFVWLLQRNEVLPHSVLRRKLEKTFMNDKLLTGDTLCRGRGFQEERRYYNEELGLTIDFMFLTRCLTDRLKQKLSDIKSTCDSPDVIIINSCTWDICRWGPDGVSQYKKNIGELMRLMKKCLAPTTLVLWTTTPPVASHIKGGFLIKQIEFMQSSIRFEILEANLFVRQEVIAHGFDVLDFHYYLILQLHNRVSDGIHWRPETVRYLTNLILTHIALSWSHPLPGNFSGSHLERLIAASTSAESESAGTTAELARLDAVSTASCKPSVSVAAPTKKTVKRRNKRKRPNRDWDGCRNHFQLHKEPRSRESRDIREMESENKENLVVDNGMKTVRHFGNTGSDATIQCDGSGVVERNRFGNNATNTINRYGNIGTEPLNQLGSDSNECSKRFGRVDLLNGNQLGDNQMDPLYGNQLGNTVVSQFANGEPLNRFDSNQMDPLSRNQLGNTVVNQLGNGEPVNRFSTNQVDLLNGNQLGNGEPENRDGNNQMDLHYGSQLGNGEPVNQYGNNQIDLLNENQLGNGEPVNRDGNNQMDPLYGNQLGSTGMTQLGNGEPVNQFDSNQGNHLDNTAMNQLNNTAMNRLDNTALNQFDNTAMNQLDSTAMNQLGNGEPGNRFGDIQIDLFHGEPENRFGGSQIDLLAGNQLGNPVMYQCSNSEPINQFSNKHYDLLNGNHLGNTVMNQFDNGEPMNRFSNNQIDPLYGNQFGNTVMNQLGNVEPVNRFRNNQIDPLYGNQFGNTVMNQPGNGEPVSRFRNSEIDPLYGNQFGNTVMNQLGNVEPVNRFRNNQIDPLYGNQFGNTVMNQLGNVEPVNRFRNNQIDPLYGNQLGNAAMNQLGNVEPVSRLYNNQTDLLNRSQFGNTTVDKRFNRSRFDRYGIGPLYYLGCNTVRNRVEAVNQFGNTRIPLVGQYGNNSLQVVNHSTSESTLGAYQCYHIMRGVVVNVPTLRAVQTVSFQGAFRQ